MGRREWTKNQQKAIRDRGGTLLLSAAAGSGKTAVLVERAVGLMLDRTHPMDADRLLIVSFSRAAAAELRQRLAARLAEIAAENPADPLAIRQRQLLERACIGTVHAFCLELLREHFQRLELSAGFAIADDSQTAQLRQQAMKSLLEELYAKEDNAVFRELVELFASDRDDRRLVEAIESLYGFVRSHPFYDRWLAQKLELYQSFQRAGDSVWGQIARSFACEAAEACLSVTEAAVVLAGECESTRKAYLPALLEDQKMLSQFAQMAPEAPWDSLCGMLQSWTLPRLGSIRGEEDLAARDQIKAMRARVKKTLEELRTRVFVATEAQFEEDLCDLLPKLTELFSAVSRYDSLYSELKRDRQLVDFSDLEQLALRLLAVDEHAFTPLAAELSERYDQIMVDECQDTNGAQDLIFAALDGGRGKLFLVGDVKQSIYRFRQAMPELFVEKRDRFAPYDGKSHPACLALGHNFRSRPEITREINGLFSLLMSRRMGEIDYTPEEYLISAGTFPPSGQAGWELHLLDLPAGALSAADAAEMEARYLARLIRSMIASGYQVADGAGTRPMRPGDVCLLLRSYSGRVRLYCRALAEEGLSPVARLEEGYLESREVAAVLNLLRAIDNPLRDIPLVGAVMSPAFGFSADDIARIRLYAKQGSFYEALTAAAAGGCEKSAGFLEFLSDYRRHAATLPADRLLGRLYKDTGFELMAGAMPDGAQRRANLRLLVDYASHYDRLGYKGLSAFVAVLDGILERGGDLARAPAAGGEDGVAVMSVHNAKGLEFPVVILADTGHGFNREDLRRPVILHPHLGFACMRRIPSERRQFVTLPLAAVRLEQQRGALSEEMRILYVALTRAKEKLIVSAALRDPARKARELYTPLDREGRIPPYAVAGSGSFSDWILMATAHHPRLGAALLSGEDACIPGFRLCFACPDAGGAADISYLEAQPAQPDPHLLLEWERRLRWRYPFEAETKTPAKLSVSQLSHGADGEFFSRTPAFLQGGALSSAQRGSAAHRFMQLCDYRRAAADCAAERDRLVEGGFLTPAEGEALILKQVERFFASPLAERMFSARRLVREHKFIFQVDGELIARCSLEGRLGEGTVLQGVADCYFIEADGGAVLVDYKTDRVKNAGALLERYGTQLKLYREILRRALGLRVKECILYSFYLGSEIPLDSLLTRELASDILD
jgi:ATP-dependent helicase/nuclease subunit A